MNLSQNLKNKREEHSFSQEDIAQKLNVSRQSVSKWENGNCYPDLDNLISLSELYNISLDELVKGNKDFRKEIIIQNTDNKLPITQWWALIPIIGMLYGLISMILKHF
ncbi:helix-turn-helix domain-containing protein [Lysinibacillus sp. NPDC095746]|uniref:helix-turn-helix domain-containing protein n=1 Tax=unclassified Lysinibacillus TaxID=2636778 RepID=UPI0023636BB8|nr:helix-turn-helix transcriptional regulator [Lysinibacillus sp. CNPSo 3705]MDD1503316.1 helix-turn-helix transcriptional regulator [Lysinibacillus sp. CNPSo 3705]